MLINVFTVHALSEAKKKIPYDDVDLLFLSWNDINDAFSGLFHIAYVNKWHSYCSRHSNKEYMTVEDLHLFLEGEQGVSYEKMCTK